MVFSDDTWVLKIEPRALRSLVHSATGVACPAVISLVPKVVRISVGSVLDAVIALSVQPIGSLQELRETSSRFVRV